MLISLRSHCVTDLLISFKRNVQINNESSYHEFRGIQKRKKLNSHKLQTEQNV